MSDYYENSNNSGYNRGTWPYSGDTSETPQQGPSPEAQQGLETTSFMLGIAAIASTCFMTVVLPCILAPISIVLAVLSKGRRKHVRGAARHAVILSAVSLLLNAILIGTSVSSLFRSPETRGAINQVTEQMYGTTVEQMIGQIDQNLGTNLSSLLRGDSSRYSGADSTTDPDDQGSDSTENGMDGGDNGTVI